MSVHNSSWTVERDYPHPPNQVFAAWADPSIKVRWSTSDYRSDFRVGGIESFRTPPAPAPVFAYDAQYRDIVDNERIITT